MFDYAKGRPMKNNFKFRKSSMVALLTGLLLSSLVFYQVQQFEKNRIQNEFSAIASSYFILISHAWKASLKDIISFKYALEHELVAEHRTTISAKDFDTLANILSWESGETLALAWVPRITSNHLETFERQVKESLNSSFHIHQQTNSDDKLQHQVSPKNHFPIYLSRIVESPDMSPGLDLSIIPEFSNAFTKSINNRKPTAIYHTGDYDDKAAVFSIISPIFLPHEKSNLGKTQNKSLLGFIIVDLSISALLENVIQDIPAYGLHIQLRDALDGNEQLTYTHISRLAKVTEPTESSLYLEKSFVLADRSVKVRFDASQAFINIHSHNLQWVILTICILLTLFITLVFAYISEKRSASLYQKKLSAAIEQSGQGILITDNNGIIEYVNHAFTEITGFTHHELIGSNPKIISSGKQNKAFYKNMWDTILAGKIWRGAITDRRKDGSFYPASLTISPITDAKGEITHFIGTNEDLSLQKKLEEKLHQSQKLEAVGTLVAGVAHNFNNLLAGMIGMSFLGKKHVSSPEKALGYFTSIDELSHRAADIVSQLLMFSRETPVDMQDIPYTTIMKETAKTARIGIPENIRFIMDFTNEPLTVHGNVAQLQQVLMNLIGNARDALANQETGTITVSLKASELEKCHHKDTCNICTSFTATLTVEDTGNGIAPENLQHIFEPFFTTKEIGQGTGLGLSTLHGTIQLHAGIVDVESTLGKGTKFTVCLPASKKNQPSANTNPAAFNTLSEKTILIIDDDKTVRTTLKQVLASLGYKVLSESDGAQAVEKFQQYHDEISLLMTDIIMPNMNGYEAVEKIRGINNKIPVIYITGYDSDTSKEKLHLDEITQLINKPFNVSDLSHTLNKMLSRRP